MELVFRHPEGQQYGGIDVGVGGERYIVIKEGSRQLLRGIPNHLAPQLEAHHWVPTGMANADIVEQAAQEAFRAKAKVDVAEKLALQAKQDAKDADAELERQKGKRDEQLKKDAEADKKSK